MVVIISVNSWKSVSRRVIKMSTISLTSVGTVEIIITLNWLIDSASIEHDNEFKDEVKARTNHKMNRFSFIKKY